jgi:hypothetical protein
MDQLKDPFNPDYANTWKVASNKLTWALRHASIAYTALSKADGTIIISYKLTDKFDIRPGENHTDAYNKVTKILGPLYHDVVGGNDQMRVQAYWQAIIK